MTKNAPLYKGSFTWSWNTTSGTSQAIPGPSTYFRFNVVKLEALSFIDLTTGFPPGPVPTPLFVVVNELLPVCFEYVSGNQLRAIGGAQWGGGGYLIINETLAPFKMTSEKLEILRGTLTFSIYGGDGVLITTANPSYKAVTISFWETTEALSSTG